MNTQTQTPANGANSANRRYVRPRAHVVEDAEGYLVQVEMPGVNKAGLEITFENGDLTLVGRRSASAPEGAEALYRESQPTDFRRVFEVDSSIDASQIGAALDQGLLTLRLPKAEAAKPRRIEIAGLN